MGGILMHKRPLLLPLPPSATPGQSGTSRENETPKMALGDREAEMTRAEFRTRRPRHISETPRYRAVFERSSYVRRWRPTGWLGRQDSKLCILDRNYQNSQPGGQHSNLRVSDCSARASLLNKFLASFTTARTPKFSRSDFKMQRFESCRLELEVLAIPILECRCSNPAAPASHAR